MREMQSNTEQSAPAIGELFVFICSEIVTGKRARHELNRVQLLAMTQYRVFRIPPSCIRCVAIPYEV